MAADEKKVLALDGYDPGSLQPVALGEVLFQPGERVRGATGPYEGMIGVVQGVGFAGDPSGEGLTLYNGVVADVVFDGYEDPDRIHIGDLEGAS